jgi:hypothetical protein
VEFISLLMQVEGGNPYRGHDGIRSWWERLLGISPDFSAEIEELRDLGDLTIARARSHGHGLECEAPVEKTFWQVAEWRRNKVIWWRFVRAASPRPLRPHGFPTDGRYRGRTGAGVSAGSHETPAQETICERGVRPATDDRSPRPMQARGGWRAGRPELA